jgi:adenylate kinase family enzyme
VRVAIIGSSGAGKSTLGQALAARLGCPFVELDAIFHQANWTPLEDEVFRARVAEQVAGERWVVDGNYAAVRPLVLARATDVVWLDLPKAIVMKQVIVRSLRRVIDRRPLWNGNRERLRAWLDADHPIRYAWRKFDERRRHSIELFASPELAHARLHRLRNHAEIDRFLRRARSR